MHSLKRLDVFPKFDSQFEKDARDKTAVGALLSIGAIAIMVLLVIGEAHFYFSTEVKKELFVDPNVEGQLTIDINVTFPHVPCDLMTLDAVDFFGNFQEGMDAKTTKHRLDGDGNRISLAKPLVDSKKDPGRRYSKSNAIGGPENDHCGSCYGAEMNERDCCKTCDDVKRRYEMRGWQIDISDISIVQCAKERLQEAAMLASQEGCNIYAKLDVGRVQGNIHFIPGRQLTMNGMHLHDFGSSIINSLNLSHVVNTLHFGPSFPGMENPLDDRSVDLVKRATGKMQYFIKVVPTRYEARGYLPLGIGSSGALETYQYSVTDHFSARQDNERVGSRKIAGVFFLYEFSPIKIRVYEAGPFTSFVHFILQLCAICGGVFTVAGLIDAFLYHSVQTVQRKRELGKFQ